MQKSAVKFINQAYNVVLKRSVYFNHRVPCHMQNATNSVKTSARSWRCSYKTTFNQFIGIVKYRSSHLHRIRTDVLNAMTCRKTESKTAMSSDMVKNWHCCWHSTFYRVRIFYKCHYKSEDKSSAWSVSLFKLEFQLWRLNVKKQHSLPLKDNKYQKHFKMNYCFFENRNSYSMILIGSSLLFSFFPRKERFNDNQHINANMNLIEYSWKIGPKVIRKWDLQFYHYISCVTFMVHLPLTSCFSPYH